MGEVFSERGPNFLNYVQHIFPLGRKILQSGLLAPCDPPVEWLRVCIVNASLAGSVNNTVNCTTRPRPTQVVLVVSSIV